MRVIFRFFLLVILIIGFYYSFKRDKSTNTIKVKENMSLQLQLPKSYVIVVGSGLAGLSAANQLLTNGKSVVLLDKQGKFF